jgi:hypothetical protein
MVHDPDYEAKVDAVCARVRGILMEARGEIDMLHETTRLGVVSPRQIDAITIKVEKPEFVMTKYGAGGAQ